MRYYSTNNRNHIVGLKEAVLQSLPPDGGLYMPENIPVMSPKFIDTLGNYSFQQTSYMLAKPFLSDDLSFHDIMEIVDDSIDFPAPVITLNDSISVLELFHGPSLAFKDFGARFMARLMSKLNRKESGELNILVATSGDTGGAVAAGFYEVPGINIIILYPSGRVSDIQEKQLTTLGRNILAIEVNGSFDDCQALVKKAFLDVELNNKMRLNSANSINISRLIPQMFYYFEAYKQVQNISKDIVFSIPSGNFGNLTAAVMARKMGLPIKNFLAATNINRIVPDYLSSGKFEPRESIPTISNAMDVGNPSNFSRLMDLFANSHDQIKSMITGYSFDDQKTKEAILSLKSEFNYLIDPHGAVGFLAAKEYLAVHPADHCIVVETAHPCKFDSVYSDLKLNMEIPEKLSGLLKKKKEAIKIEKDYSSFKKLLWSR